MVILICLPSSACSSPTETLHRDSIFRTSKYLARSCEVLPALLTRFAACEIGRPSSRSDRREEDTSPLHATQQIYSLLRCLVRVVVDYPRDRDRTSCTVY